MFSYRDESIVEIINGHWRLGGGLQAIKSSQRNVLCV